MNTWWIASDDTLSAADSQALALMLDYVIAEAERLGLHRCAHHAALARAASRSAPLEPLHS